ncbi:hypothetical protein U91I_00927 [alpha proteobacterium U9-1i]|nr:hypothetical protein U91I_00927 [alpha proteobacterium U9-1i]
MLKFIAPAAAAIAMFALASCGQTTTVDNDTPTENALEEAGNDLENAADQAGEEIEQAGENAADAVDDATDGNPNTNP